MKFTVASVLAATAAVVSASPCVAPGTNTGTNTNTNTGTNNNVFRLSVTKTGNLDLHNQDLVALDQKFVVGANQTADCDGPTPNHAQFKLEDGSLKLYTKGEEQKVYVDASGMGQGNVWYRNGDGPAARNAQYKDFSLDAHNFVVLNNSTAFQACPGGSGNYEIWYKVVEKPASIEGCLDVRIRASESTKPVKCQYSNGNAQ